MKNVIILTSLLCFNVSANEFNDLSSITQDTNQQNSSINSPTSVMNNTQVNGGVTFDSYGAGVTCSRPTMQVGATGSVNNRGYNTGTQLYVGVSIPLGSGSECKKAARSQLFLTEQRRLTLRELMRRDNEEHKHEMKRKDLMYADLLAKVCINFHSQVVAATDSTMAKECKDYLVIDHHAPKYESTEYSRVSSK